MMMLVSSDAAAADWYSVIHCAVCGGLLFAGSLFVWWKSRQGQPAEHEARWLVVAQGIYIFSMLSLNPCWLEWLSTDSTVMQLAQ